MIKGRSRKFDNNTSCLVLCYTMIIEHMTERLTTAARRVDIRLNVGIRITLYFYTIHMLNIVTIQFWYRNETGT